MSFQCLKECFNLAVRSVTYYGSPCLVFKKMAKCAHHEVLWKYFFYYEKQVLSSEPGLRVFLLEVVLSMLHRSGGWNYGIFCFFFYLGSGHH